MNELHLFAGGGGGILGGMLIGHRPVCAVEIEPYCRDILLQRQRDGILPWFPIWDDVRSFPGHEWRGRVDIVCGGFPCQDISVAGKGGRDSVIGFVIRDGQTGGSLNPSWVEWLMGWPIGWTDLKPLATDKFQQWLHSHGVC